MTCILKILFIFVLLNLITGRHHCPTDEGHFLCPEKYGSGVLLSDGVSPHSPGKGLSSRKGITAFYLVPTLRIDAMLSNLPSAPGTFPAVPAKSITNSYLPTGDSKVPRRELYCSNPSYQNPFKLNYERRTA